MLRRPTTFVHEVRVILGAGADPEVIGAAVTEALCGDWDHQPPCRWPHHTSIDAEAGFTVARTVFLARRREAEEVRRRIDVRMSDGRLVGPDGRPSAWQHMRSGGVPPSPDEYATGLVLEAQLHARA